MKLTNIKKWRNTEPTATDLSFVIYSKKGVFLRAKLNKD